MAKITPASGKEETCAKAFLIGEIARNRTSNGRLASSSYSTQPKDTGTPRIFNPFFDLLEEVNSGLGQA
jgi:hypothetical protein